MDTVQLPLPPRLETATGATRRIGVEVEFTGLAIDQIVDLVARQVGGKPEVISPYEQRIEGGRHGTYRVELDVSYLLERGRQEKDESSVLAPLEDAAEEIVRMAAEQIMPFEVITPPLPMDRLGEVETLIESLRQAGAQGTGAGPVYAFGMQFNPEMPALDVETILAYQKAFFCLFDWLKRRSQIDLTRRLTAFADPFPRGYVRRVVDPTYRPTLAGLIDDYLKDNPTRNRALDMLPLFDHIDSERVRSVVDDRRIKSRPTLHYRLPNSEIDRSGWGIGEAWQDWLQVEWLVEEPERLEALCLHYAEHLDQFTATLLGDWAETVEPWLKQIDDH